MTTARYRRELMLLARRYGREARINGHIRLVGATKPDIHCSGSPRRPEVALAATERLLRRYAP